MYNKFISQNTQNGKKILCSKYCILNNFALTHQTQILTIYAQKSDETRLRNWVIWITLIFQLEGKKNLDLQSAFGN